jgi:hypothetical protein
MRCFPTRNLSHLPWEHKTWRNSPLARAWEQREQIYLHRQMVTVCKVSSSENGRGEMALHRHLLQKQRIQPVTLLDHSSRNALGGVHLESGRKGG